jgi:Methyltransferase domain
MTELSGKPTFYDKVARRFGEYRTPARSTTDYRGANPAEVFERKLVDLGRPEVVALDAGSGDGRFTLRMAAHFKYVLGIDTAREMLAVAERKRREQAVANVRFEVRDAASTGLADASFEVIYSRRGPTKYREFARLLRSGGHVLHEGIGEQDALGLKEVFGRGQGFDRLGVSWLDRARSFQEEAGLRVAYAAEFVYDEYFPTHEDLGTFLQGVPIFEDFDPVADRERLERYAGQATTPKGIHLLRHRFVTVARKA